MGGCDGRERCSSPEKGVDECTVDVYENGNTQCDVNR
jgi:hypothetical protein